jgi:hypothetical protein
LLPRWPHPSLLLVIHAPLLPSPRRCCGRPRSSRRSALTCARHATIFDPFWFLWPHSTPVACGTIRLLRVTAPPALHRGSAAWDVHFLRPALAPRLAVGALLVSPRHAISLERRRACWRFGLHLLARDEDGAVPARRALKSGYCIRVPAAIECHEPRASRQRDWSAAHGRMAPHHPVLTTPSTGRGPGAIRCGHAARSACSLGPPHVREGRLGCVGRVFWTGLIPPCAEPPLRWPQGCRSRQRRPCRCRALKHRRAARPRRQEPLNRKCSLQRYIAPSSTRCA